MNQADFLIVIGASAGGVSAIQAVISKLDPGIDAAVCIVLHLSRRVKTEPFLYKLQKSTRMPCAIIEDNMPLRKGHIYLAAADYHMIIREGRLLLGRGPGESRWRPSIDIAMRSAAVAWDTHCIGIILSGLLDDGVAGMDAIRRCGGYTIVQDVLEADYPGMPSAVLRHMVTDCCIRLADMPAAIQRRIDAVPERVPAMDDIVEEAKLAERVATRIDHMNMPQHGHSYYTCPECGGGLWEVQDEKITRYRCHIGHTYTQNELSHSQAERIETTLWVAVRMMEERRHLLLRMAEEEETKATLPLAGEYKQCAEEMELHIERLKELLFSFQRTGKRDEDTA